jgi:hypothetical protein
MEEGEIYAVEVGHGVGCCCLLMFRVSVSVIVVICFLRVFFLAR